MKKCIALAAAAVLVTSLLPSMAGARAYVVGSESKVNVYVNSQLLQLDQNAMVKNGRTLVPFRAVLEAMGATIAWDEATRTVQATKGDIEIALPLGSATATVNGQSVKLDVPAEQINYRTMVPLRFMAEALGLQIGWAGKTSSVFVSDWSAETIVALGNYTLDVEEPVNAYYKLSNESNTIFLNFMNEKITFDEYKTQYNANLAQLKAKVNEVKALAMPTEPVAKACATRSLHLMTLDLDFAILRGEQTQSDKYDEAAAKKAIQMKEELLADREAFEQEFKTGN